MGANDASTADFGPEVDTNRALPLRVADHLTPGGVQLVWEERPGLTISIESHEPLTEDDLQLVAEGLRPFPPEAWAQLRAALAAVPGEEPGMEPIVVGRGEIAGDAWTLTALVPPEPSLFAAINGHPSCVEVTFRGETAHDLPCGGGWAPAGGQVFAIGTAPPGTEEVVVETERGPSRPADVFDSPRGLDVSYWIAPLPPDSCSFEARSGGEVLLGGPPPPHLRPEVCPLR